jgi:hypothetical protein
MILYYTKINLSCDSFHYTSSTCGLKRMKSRIKCDINKICLSSCMNNYILRMTGNYIQWYIMPRHDLLNVHGQDETTPKGNTDTISYRQNLPWTPHQWIIINPRKRQLLEKNFERKLKWNLEMLNVWNLAWESTAQQVTTATEARRRWEGQGEWCTCIEESKTDGKPEH